MTGDSPKTMGFLTDATICIGCKACEVACKEWNDVPADGFVFGKQSYDHSGALGASTWRHVKFVESEAAGEPRWDFLSDVCKHCENAGCLDACPTGAIVRTGAGSVLVQDDICNGCGYCVVSCPFGVIDRRESGLAGAGGAYKCTMCWDRQEVGDVPACAQTCPTESIRFGPLDELQDLAEERLQTLEARGTKNASLYDARQSPVGGVHSLSIVVGDPERFGLPASPVLPSDFLKPAWTSALASGVGAFALAYLAFVFA